MKKILLLILIVIFWFTAASQIYNSGQDAGSLKWRQIKDTNFVVVYPVGSDSAAQIIANALRWAYANVTSDMHHQPKMVKVLLHTEAANSNGMVTWAPKRMELFSTPPVDNYPQDWYEQLAIHEYRHVIQIDKLNQGLTKLLYFIFGEQAVGGVLGVYIPLWFLEGDAVWAETNYSLTGRGRQVSFSDPLRVQVLQRIIYTYDKATMGSYRDFIPNHYIIGYQLVNESRRRSGNELWPNTLKFVGRNPYLIVPFNRSLKKQTGVRKVDFYNSIMLELRKDWKKNLSTSNSFGQKIIYKPKEKDYYSYRFPFQIHDSVYFALKTSLDNIPKFVAIDARKSKKEEWVLLVPGYSEFYNISLKDSVICWDEIRFDPRWEHRRYHVIMTYDLRNSKCKQITNKTRYYQPELNKDAGLIACIEISPNNHYYLKVIDRKSEKIIRSFELPYMASTFCWAKSDSTIYYVAHGKQGHFFESINLNSGLRIPLSKPDYFTKSLEWVAGDTLFFIAEYNGAGNLYYKIIGNDKITQTTLADYSISDAEPSLDGSIIYSLPFADGNKMMCYSINEAKNKVVELKTNYNDSLFKADVKTPNLQRDGMPIQEFKSKRYSKFAHLLNIHSWGPVTATGSTIDINPGFSISSQNLSGTSTLSAGVNYSPVYKVFMPTFSYLYNGFYPAISLTFNELIVSTGGVNYQYKFYQPGLRLPLNFTKRKFIRTITPSVSARIQKTIAQGVTSFIYNGQLTLGFAVYQRMAHRDFKPGFGIIGNLIEITSMGRGSELFASNLYFFLPGLLKHHSFRLYGGIQRDFNFKYSNVINFSNYILIPRGSNPDYANLMNAFSMEYSFPIEYPDVSIKGLLYIKRIRANLFYDYMHSELFEAIRSYNYASAGLDIIFDTHLFRLITPVQIGLRTIYSESKPIFMLIFSIDAP